MATKYWIGAAQEVAGLHTTVPANVNIGNVFTLTFPNGRVFSFTATAATVANVTAGLVALLQASEDPLVAELDYDDITTAFTTTGDPGKSFFFTSSASGGTATLVTTVTTAATGPNWWTNIENWDGGVVPANTDTVIIDNTAVSILYGIDATSVGSLTLAELRIGAGFTGTIGLPEQDGDGYANAGYRTTYLEVPATLVNIGAGVGTGSGRIKWNGGSVQTLVTVYGTGQQAETGIESVVIVGTHAANVVNVLSGSVGICTVPSISATSSNLAATVATLRVGSSSESQPATVRIGQGTTLTDVVQVGGTIISNVACTTITKLDGTFTLIGTGAVTTITNDGGTFTHQSSGTITTLNSGNRGVFQFGADVRPVTVTNCNVYFNSETYDPGNRVTFTNGIVLVRCSLLDVKLQVGTGVTITGV